MFEPLKLAALSLTNPFTYLAHPAQRLYWVYLVGAVVLAVLVRVATTRRRRRRPMALLRWLTAKSLWLHPSARLDYQYLFAKAVIKTLFLTPWLGASFGLAVWTAARLQDVFGRASPSSTSPHVVTALYTVALFVLSDLSRWAVHAAAHAVPALWELHKVHHSAEVMTPFTLYRSHPLETALFQLRGVAVTGLLAGAFFYGFGSSAAQLELFGVNAIGFVLNLLGGNLRHSHVRLAYPAWLERVFISPAQHQLHHSSDPAHFHQNCGAWLAVWDWMAGRLLLSRDARPVRFGLPAGELNHRPTHLLESIWGPLRAALRPASGG